LNQHGFAWRDFLEVAEELARGGPEANEAHHRAAVSRAYYAAFHAARVFLAAKRQVAFPGGGTDHDVAIREMLRHKGKLGGQLRALREKRTWADYKLDARVPENESRIALAWAKNIVGALDSER
jgi:hypothetical protein